jgi:hypothetical protein
MSPDQTSPSGRHDDDDRSADALRRIRDAVSSLRYGSVLVIVQDGVVVQIERTEKTRLEKPASAARDRR